MSAILSTPPRTPRRNSNRPNIAASSRPASSPPCQRTPLGNARTLKHSRSNGTLARQFVDRHSTTYAHLYKYDNEVIEQKQMEREKQELEAARIAGREKRERLETERTTGVPVGQEGGKENGGEAIQGVIPGRKAGWRPLSLVAKRQPNTITHGHSRSASHQIPSVATRSALRAVSQDPYISSDRSGGERDRNTSRSSYRLRGEPDRLDAVLEGVPTEPNTPFDELNAEDILSADTTLMSEPRSTYSWASAFSGETAELRMTATYIRRSLDDARQDDVVAQREEEEVLDTPEKVHRRRKRIVAIAHTVRQLEGVGSREPEDPNFYGELVKAWNERPGFGPAAESKAYGYDPALAPPPLLPPPDLSAAHAYPSGGTAYPPRNEYNAYPPSGSYLAYGQHPELSPAPTLHMSPAFDRHFGSPAEQQLFTPAMPYQEHSTPLPQAYGAGTLYTSVDELDAASDTSSDLRARSFRYSYASALHDLALEEHSSGEGRGGMDGPAELGGLGASKEKAKAWGKGPVRWSGAWEGWGSAPQPVQNIHSRPDGGHTNGAALGAIQPKTPERTTRHNVERQPVPKPSDQVGSVLATPNFSKPLPARLNPDSGPEEELADSPAESTPKAGWGLGFMSAWWSDRSPPSSRATPDRQQDFHSGEGRPTLTPSSNASPRNASATPSPNTSATASETISGVSTPSFGMRIHTAAERRWVAAESARPALLALPLPPPPPAVQERADATVSTSVSMVTLHSHANMYAEGPAFAEVESQSNCYQGASPSPHPRASWLTPHHVHSSATTGASKGLHLGITPSMSQPMALHTSTSSGMTASQSASTATSLATDEREFPFSDHCRPPSMTISSTSYQWGQAGRTVREQRESPGLPSDQSREGLNGEAGQDLSSAGWENGSSRSAYLSHPPIRPSHPRGEEVEVLIPETEIAPRAVSDDPSPSRFTRPSTGPGLLQRRHVGPLKLGELLNPLPTAMLHRNGEDAIRTSPGPGKVGIRTELPSFTSHPTLLCMTSVTSTSTATLTSTGASSSLCPTPVSVQTHFLPPANTPKCLTPTTLGTQPQGEFLSPNETLQHLDRGPESTADALRRDVHANSALTPKLRPLQQQNYDPSSSPSDLSGASGVTRPALPDRALEQATARGPLQHPCPSTGLDASADADRGTYRDPTPSVHMAVAPAKRKTGLRITPKVLFWLGWFMPWCWILGGWSPAAYTSTPGGISKAEPDLEKGETANTTSQTWTAAWLHHPDPWARRCRIVSATALPAVAVLGVIGVIVLAATRGR